jgi:hypothetical protein
MCERDKNQLSSKLVIFRLDALLDLILISRRQLLTEAILLYVYYIPIYLNGNAFLTL